MKLAQHRIKWLSRLMLVLALFTQGTIAAYACATPAAGPVQVFASDQGAHQAMPCHQQDKAGGANACLLQCTQSDQLSASQGVSLAVPAATVIHTVIAPAAQPVCQACFPEYVALNSGPPLAIRFCSFLI